MRIMLMTLAALVAVSATAEAAGRHKHKSKYNGQRGAYVERQYSDSYAGSRRFSQRDMDQLPIRITKPDNMRHYVYQNYPGWAAEAMQPKWWTR